jgi:signal transduction histidine kinase
VFELVKNSLRAVQDRFDSGDDEPPPIRLVVAEGGEDVTIKVSDEGGGIPRSGLPRIWSYLYSTAKSPVVLDDAAVDGNGPNVLAGYGYGLPISRLYARYFGGDLQIISMEGARVYMIWLLGCVCLWIWIGIGLWVFGGVPCLYVHARIPAPQPQPTSSKTKNTNNHKPTTKQATAPTRTCT